MIGNRGLPGSKTDRIMAYTYIFHWIGFVGKILTGNHGFYHEI